MATPPTITTVSLGAKGATESAIATPATSGRNHQLPAASSTCSANVDTQWPRSPNQLASTSAPRPGPQRAGRGEGLGGAGRSDGDVPHLATGTGGGLAVEVQLRRGRVAEHSGPVGFAGGPRVAEHVDHRRRLDRE